MQRERKKEAMVLKCLKCAIVATQATPSSPHSPVVSLIPKLGLPLFMLMLQPERDHTVCPLGFAVDLICWNNSRFPPCGECPALMFYSLGLQYQVPAKVGWRVFVLKTGPGSFWFLNELQSRSHARGDYFSLDMLQFDSSQHSKS